MCVDMRVLANRGASVCVWYDRFANSFISVYALHVHYPVEVAVTVKRPARHANFPQSSRRPKSCKQSYCGGIVALYHAHVCDLTPYLEHLHKITSIYTTRTGFVRDQYYFKAKLLEGVRNWYRSVCRVTRNVVASTSATLSVSSTGNLALSWYSNPESRGNSEASAS
jgi:hypothetical protein